MLVKYGNSGRDRRPRPDGDFPSLIEFGCSPAALPAVKSCAAVRPREPHEDCDCQGIRRREPRVAATPDTVKKFQGAGHRRRRRAGRGRQSGPADAEFEAAGAAVTADAVKDADIVIKVKRPEAAEVGPLTRRVRW